MTDSDLLMVENLTYFGDEQQNNAGVTKSIEQCETVEEFLNQFDDKTLHKMDIGDADSQEWAARIRYMKSNNEISSLTIKETNPDIHCILFEDAKDPNHAIVAFKGTSGGNEWIDNVEGLNRADTDAQMNARDYIDKLEYGSVTVTGHSKGGNKAMYVAVTCDKVDRCVAYDGQGFSKEFIDKYSVGIQKNSSKIKNYSLSSDYVHILMYPIPGVEQIYMEPGNRVNKIGGAHYPIGPFRLKEVNGKWCIDEEGGVVHISGKEDPSMTILHDFTTFLMNNMSDEELGNVVGFISPLLAGFFSEGENFDAAQYILSNKDDAIKIAAYLLRYLKDNNMGVDDLIRICESLGISRSELLKILGETMHVPDWIAEKVLYYAFDQVTDGGEDGFTHFVLGLLGSVGILDGDQAELISSVWRLIENEYNNIKPKAGSENYVSLIRDYSRSVYDSIMSAIESFENCLLPEASAWNVYSAEGWFAKIQAAVAIKCINGYRGKLSEINVECRRRVNTTFDNIASVDDIFARKMDASISSVRTLTFRIRG